MDYAEIGCLVIMGVWSLIVLLIIFNLIRGCWQNRKEKKELKKKEG